MGQTDVFSVDASECEVQSGKSRQLSGLSNTPPDSAVETEENKSNRGTNYNNDIHCYARAPTNEKGF